jgi:hypothetical protein
MGAEAEEEVVPDDSSQSQGEELLYAARTGDTARVKELLAAGVPVGFHKGASGWTPLKWAASEGHEEVLTLLLEHGAAEAEMDASKMAALAAQEGGAASSGSPLHWAAYKGHVRLVYRLLTCKPKMSAKELDGDGNMPLHCAAAGGSLKCIETMLSQGVDVNIANAYGNKPVQLTTDPKCSELLKAAMVAAKEGRYYLCACSHEFCSESKSVADVVIDRVSAPNSRPVRYSMKSMGLIRAAEDNLTHAIKDENVPKLEEAIEAADKIGASLPLIVEATAALERLKAQIALHAAVTALQEARPLQDRTLLRPMHAPIQRSRETGVAASMIADAEALCQTAESEVVLFDLMELCQPLKMADTEGLEEGGSTEPPSAESEMAKKAEALIGKLAAAIGAAQSVEAKQETVAQAEAELNFLTGEHELRKALLQPKQGTIEETNAETNAVTVKPTWTQHNGQVCYSVLEDLTFRDAFLDSSIEKCMAAGTAVGILNHAGKIQKDLKALLKQAQIDEEARLAAEAAAAAKAAKKKKGK